MRWRSGQEELERVFKVRARRIDDDGRAFRGCRSAPPTPIDQDFDHSRKAVFLDLNGDTRASDQAEPARRSRADSRRD